MALTKQNPTVDQIGQVGLGVAPGSNVVIANLLDGDTNTLGFGADNADAGAHLTIDCGIGNGCDYQKAIIKTSAGRLRVIFDIQYSSNGASWSTAYTGWNLNESGSVHQAQWASVGSPRFWRFYKTNAATAGSFATELEMYAPEPAISLHAPVVTGTASPTQNRTPQWLWSLDPADVDLINWPTFRYKLDSSDLTTGATVGTETSYTPSEYLSVATHTLYVQVQNPNGTWSDSGSYAITIQSYQGYHSPVVTGGSGVDNPYPQWQFWIDSQDTIAIPVFMYGFEYDEYSQSITDGRYCVGLCGIVNYTAESPLAVGSHTLYVQLQNTDGTWTPPGSYAINVQYHYHTPQVFVDGSDFTKRPTWSWTPNILDTVPDTPTYRYKLDDNDLTVDAVETQTVSFTPTEDLSIGVHTLFVQIQNFDETWSDSGLADITIVEPDNENITPVVPPIPQIPKGPSGFIFDLSTGNLIDLDFYAQAGYYDTAEGILYLSVNGKIYQFATGNDYRTIEYLTKRYRYRPNVFSCAQVIASKYPVTIDVQYPDSHAAATFTALDNKPMRIRPFMADSCQLLIRDNKQVSIVFLANSLQEFTE